MGGLEVGRESRGGWCLQKQWRGQPQQKDLIRETVWKRKIDVEKILKYEDGAIMPWKQKGEGFLEEKEEKELSGGASTRLWRQAPI